jgi:hypothetical protein
VRERARRAELHETSGGRADPGELLGEDDRRLAFGDSRAEAFPRGLDRGDGPQPRRSDEALLGGRLRSASKIAVPSRRAAPAAARSCSDACRAVEPSTATTFPVPRTRAQSANGSSASCQVSIASKTPSRSERGRSKNGVTTTAGPIAGRRSAVSLSLRPMVRLAA